MQNRSIHTRCKTDKERRRRRAAAQKRYESTPRGKFAQHRKNAKRRGVAFELTFEQWDTIWSTSGHYPERGLTRGTWVMGRHHDQGPYSAGNVEIIKRASNTTLRNRRYRKHSQKHPWSNPNDPGYESWQHVHAGINDD